MNIIILDDEEIVLNATRYECEKYDDINVVGTFNNPIDALEFISKNNVDCALLDVEMPGINGIELAKRINLLNCNILIIFITGYDSYALEAFEEFAIGYLVKPLNNEKLKLLLERAISLTKKSNEKKIKITTFGRFNVFLDDRPVVFRSVKAKELLAICVDGLGGTVDMDTIIGKLWPDKPYDERVKVLYRKAIISLRETLLEYRINSFFITARGVCYIDKNMCSCDLFDLLENGDASSYKGYYMVEYEWPEETNATLRRKYTRK